MPHPLCTVHLECCTHVAESLYPLYISFQLHGMVFPPQHSTFHSRAVIALSSLSSDDNIDFNKRANCFSFSSRLVMTLQFSLFTQSTTCATKSQVRMRTRRAELNFTTWYHSRRATELEWECSQENVRGEMFAREHSQGATGDRTVAWERSRGAMGDITVVRERSRGAMGERIVMRERSRGATFRATVNCENAAVKRRRFLLANVQALC